MQPNKDRDGAPKPSRPRPIMDMYPAPRSAGRPLPQLPATRTRPTARTDNRPAQTGSNIKPALSRTSTTKPTNKDIERPSAVFILSLLLILIVLAAGGATAYYFLKYKPAHMPAVASKPVNDNANHITDDTLGIKFLIDKGLTAIATPDLIKQNPYFVYGFRQTDVANVACTISQQKRTPAGGPVNPVALRDGSFKGIQKAYPDAKLDSYEDTTLSNGQDAASLTLHYTNNKVAIKEKMLVAATRTNVTFAFCTSPQPLFSYYDAKFEPFFNSLAIY